MSTYSTQDKLRALDLLAEYEDVASVSAEMGISMSTLRKWRQQRREIRARYLLEKVERLHAQLAENAVHLAAAMGDAVDSAPLNQISTALASVVDRYLKVDEHLAALNEHHVEQVTRFEFKYPDGTVHDVPPWANPDYEEQEAVQSSRMWPPLWQDRNRQKGHRVARDGRAADMVAGSDTRDGKRSLARSENGVAALAGSAD